MVGSRMNCLPNPLLRLRNAVACAVLSAVISRIAQMSAEDSGHYSTESQTGLSASLFTLP